MCIWLWGLYRMLSAPRSDTGNSKNGHRIQILGDGFQFMFMRFWPAHELSFLTAALWTSDCSIRHWDGLAGTIEIDSFPAKCKPISWNKSLCMCMCILVAGSWHKQASFLDYILHCILSIMLRHSSPHNIKLHHDCHYRNKSRTTVTSVTFASKALTSLSHGGGILCLSLPQTSKEGGKHYRY